MLNSYWTSVKYGASFPCCCCQTLKFRKNVEKVKEAENLRTQEQRDLFLDTVLLNSTDSLFLMMDDVWICKDCRKSVDAGKMPLLSAKNNLSATWRNLPDPLRSLSIEELETLAVTQIFSVLHDLSTGGATGPHESKKTLLLPLARPVHDEGRPEDAVAKVSSIHQLHTRSTGKKHEVRAQRMLEALEYMSEHSGGEEIGKRALLRVWFEKESEQQGGDDQLVDLGPGTREVFVTVLPVVSDLQTDARQILYCGPLDRRTRDVYDVSAESGLEVARAEAITARQWMVHRLRSVFRGGPSNDVVLIMGILLKLELSWLNQVQGMADRLKGALMKHKGTAEYFAKAVDNTRAIQRCYGPATFSFSTTMNTESDHFLAAFISQSRESQEFKDVQVWDHGDEIELLTLRPGKTEDAHDVGYYVHLKSDVRYDSCNYHTHCNRTPLNDWGRW